MTPDLLARKVLMSAYLYYHRDHPVLSDGENDDLITQLVLCYSDVSERYKPLLDPKKEGEFSLLTSTHHCLWTRQVEGGALAWLKSKTGVELKPLPDLGISGVTGDYVDNKIFEYLLENTC